MYIKRHIDKVLERLKKSFPAVMVTGARQVGKTTLLLNNAPDAGYSTFDDYVLLDGVKKDALGFVKGLKTPAILDEIQYAPEVLRPLKIRVDREPANGAFLMTGSQQFELMKGVSESLAGRVGILTLSGLSAREIDAVTFDSPFLPSDEYLSSRRDHVMTHSSDELWRRIQRGSMPKLYASPETLPLDFYSGYVKTYIERDVRALTQVGDELAFLQFLTACAARTAQLLNMSDICRDVGITVPTAKRWLSILAASGIVYLLRPYSRNITARTVKTPKLYFMDTGLISYLCRWTSPETLENGAMARQIFETYIVSEIIKSYQNAGMEPPVYFYRDSEKREIDIVFEIDGKVYPVEIKKTSSPNANDARHFCVLPNAEQGGIVCMYDHLLPLGTVKIIPVGMI
jgi:predicted AAA+ superfamily ATPase